MGLGSLVTFATNLKKLLKVDGVIKKEKVVAFQKTREFYTLHLLVA